MVNREYEIVDRYDYKEDILKVFDKIEDAHSLLELVNKEENHEYFVRVKDNSIDPSSRPRYTRPLPTRKRKSRSSRASYYRPET